MTDFDMIQAKYVLMAHLKTQFSSESEKIQHWNWFSVCLKHAKNQITENAENI